MVQLSAQLAVTDRPAGHDDAVTGISDLEALAKEVALARASAAAARDEAGRLEDEVLHLRRSSEAVQEKERRFNAELHAMSRERSHLRAALRQVAESLTDTQLQVSQDGKLREVTVRCPEVVKLLTWLKNPLVDVAEREQQQQQRGVHVGDDDVIGLPADWDARQGSIAESVALFQADLMRIRGTNVELKSALQHRQAQLQQAQADHVQMAVALKLAVCRVSISCIYFLFLTYFWVSSLYFFSIYGSLTVEGNTGAAMCLA